MLTALLDRPIPIDDDATRRQFLIGLPVLLDELVPQLAGAVDGDPSTPVVQR